MTNQDEAVWDWFDDKDTYGVRRGDDVICYTGRTKKGYERAKEIAEALNRGEEER